MSVLFENIMFKSKQQNTKHKMHSYDITRLHSYHAFVVPLTSRYLSCHIAGLTGRSGAHCNVVLLVRPRKLSAVRTWLCNATPFSVIASKHIFFLEIAQKIDMTLLWKEMEKNGV
jgi:hypothetical protein